MNWRTRTLAGFVLAAMAAISSPSASRAETNEVRIAGAYGLVYLPTYVVLEKQLIEKHAREEGISDLKVSIVNLSGSGSINDMLLSGSIDLAASGYGPMLPLWDKTSGMQKVKVLTPMVDTPVYLISVDPRIKSIRDYGENDRIAMTTPKISIYAVLLQMAAAQEFGWDQRFKFDAISVPMAAPDAAASLLSGGTEVKSHATILPFNVLEMESGKAHLVLNSNDLLGGATSTTAMITTERFHTDNPKVYKAIVDAYQEAVDFINQNKHEAAAIYVKREPQERGEDFIYKILVDEKLIKYSTTPHGIQKLADFMYKLGTIHNKLDSWKDLFFENVHDKNGD